MGQNFKTGGAQQRGKQPPWDNEERRNDDEDNDNKNDANDNDKNDDDGR